MKKKLKKFRVQIQEEIIVCAIVEAYSEEEAREKVDEGDYSKEPGANENVQGFTALSAEEV